MKLTEIKPLNGDHAVWTASGVVAATIVHDMDDTEYTFFWAYNFLAEESDYFGRFCDALSFAEFDPEAIEPEKNIFRKIREALEPYHRILFPLTAIYSAVFVFLKWLELTA